MPANVPAMLQRIGEGIAFWQIILGARLARRSDCHKRFLANALLWSSLAVLDASGCGNWV
jgi:hypothetical protein